MIFHNIFITGDAFRLHGRSLPHLHYPVLRLLRLSLGQQRRRAQDCRSVKALVKRLVTLVELILLLYVMAQDFSVQQCLLTQIAILDDCFLPYVSVFSILA